LQGRQLDALLQMNQLLITLATATLGALGFMLIQGRKRRCRELASAAISAVFAGCCLYFGRLAYQGILWMLQSGFFNLGNAAQWTRHVHSYGLLLSVFFFPDFIIHDRGKEDGNALAARVAAGPKSEATWETRDQIRAQGRLYICQREQDGTSDGRDVRGIRRRLPRVG
jgi:hypothetical protein